MDMDQYKFEHTGRYAADEWKAEQRRRLYLSLAVGGVVFGLMSFAVNALDFFSRRAPQTASEVRP